MKRQCYCFDCNAIREICEGDTYNSDTDSFDPVDQCGSCHNSDIQELSKLELLILNRLSHLDECIQNLGDEMQGYEI